MCFFYNLSEQKPYPDTPFLELYALEVFTESLRTIIRGLYHQSQLKESQYLTTVKYMWYLYTSLQVLLRFLTVLSVKNKGLCYPFIFTPKHLLKKL